ncbi:jg19208 [Pararge aegeria aegeria]|uniref:Jg19208 protein n=1 Tax=Pararge aegeria aegeria TaxID=348720 RepID=A0A8S4SPD4_9NEOP|nr:jg19208 [Pararge aegeria aegeria]
MLFVTRLAAHSTPPSTMLAKLLKKEWDPSILLKKVLHILSIILWPSRVSAIDYIFGKMLSDVLAVDIDAKLVQIQPPKQQ